MAVFLLITLMSIPASLHITKRMPSGDKYFIHWIFCFCFAALSTLGLLISDSISVADSSIIETIAGGILGLAIFWGESASICLVPFRKPRLALRLLSTLKALVFMSSLAAILFSSFSFNVQGIILGQILGGIFLWIVPIHVFSFFRERYSRNGGLIISLGGIVFGAYSYLYYCKDILNSSNKFIYLLPLSILILILGVFVNLPDKNH